MKSSREIFAENLRTKLIERNKKQVDLAKYLGTTKATVTHLVNGENMPRMDTIDKICVFLRCEADDLLKDHFTAGWKDVYEMLDEEHRRSFWRNIIKAVRIDEDAQPIEVIY